MFIEDTHFSCLGLLCEPLGSDTITLNAKKTMRPNEVTCLKCIKILITQGVLK